MVTRPAIETAREAFAQEARDIAERGIPEEIRAAIERFAEPRYALVADEALAILREALE